MTKLYRIVSYVLDLNGNYPNKESVKADVECNRHPEFHSVKEILETQVEGYDDNHRLNKTAATKEDFDAYFAELGAEVGDPYLKDEHRRVRGIMLQQIQKNSHLESELRALKAEVESLKKVREFVSTIKDLVK